MTQHLTDRDIEIVVGLLVGWKGRLTWDTLVDAVEEKLGSRRARQTLARSSRIKTAFNNAKKRLRDSNGEDERSAPGSMHIAQDRIARLEAENAQLRSENRLLLEQFVTWQYNAYKAGLSKDQLTQSRPPVDLRPTSKRASQ